MSRSVEVRGSIESSIRHLGRGVTKEGVIAQAKNRKTHVKKTTLRKLAKAAAVGRELKRLKELGRDMAMHSNLYRLEAGKKKTVKKLKVKPRFGGSKERS